MKITDVQTVLLTGPCTNDRFLLEGRKLRSAAFIEIHTDVNVVGVGETFAGYLYPEAVPLVVEFFKPILVGQGVDDIDELWRRMYRCGRAWGRVGLGVAVISGIEAALWDLKGKLENKPVHELLGGCKHTRLPCYATGGPSNYPKAKLAEKVEYYLGLGFHAFKVGAGCIENGRWRMPSETNAIAEFEADKAAFLRQHVGNDVKILMDGHMDNCPFDAWDLETAQAVMKEVEPYNLFLFEEPLPYTDPWGYAELARGTEVPIAGGECLTAAYEWKVFIDQDSFDIGQPDASFTGGMREYTKMAAMLHKRGRKVATRAWGAGAALMQNIHCGFASPNQCILEIPPDFAGLHKELVGDSFQMKDGMVLPPQGPGLGIQLSEATKKTYPFVPGSGEFNSVPGKLMTN